MGMILKSKIILFCLLLVLASCSSKEDGYTVGKMDIIESVYSSVIVEPKLMYIVNSSTSGYIDEMNFKTGDDIGFGEIVFSIRDVQSENSASNARLVYQMAKSNYSGEVNLLGDLELELDEAERKKANDSINFGRNKKLYEKDLITSLEYERSELAYKASKTRYRLLKNNITRSEMDLRNSLSQAKNNYNSSLSRSEDALVRNEIEGIVYDVFKESGEFVTVQEPVAMIGSKDAFIIKMRIDEVDVTKLKLGQKVIVALEAYKNKTFSAKITRISPKMDSQTQTFEIEAEFIETPKSLFMGLTGEGNIVISESKSSLVIPLEYLMPNNKVTTENGLVNVKTGSRSISHVEILSGLKEGDVIFKTE
ncbi:MAG: HlyD family secretion protein [Crocinitomicaceae bacterium]|jgi:HlyD family secretion protein